MNDLSSDVNLGLRFEPPVSGDSARASPGALVFRPPDDPMRLYSDVIKQVDQYFLTRSSTFLSGQREALCTVTEAILSAQPGTTLAVPLEPGGGKSTELRSVAIVLARLFCDMTDPIAQRIGGVIFVVQKSSEAHELDELCRNAADGVLISGNATVNEAIMTGEPLPVDKNPGDTVLSGTVSAQGAFDMRAEKAGRDSAVQRLARLVESADAGKAKIVRLADRWATRIVAGALTAAGLAWMLTGDPIRAVTILVVFCPCALVLATPTAVTAEAAPDAEVAAAWAASSACAAWRTFGNTRVASSGSSTPS